MQPLVEIENVSKSFGPLKAVDGVSLSIGEGEFFALLGPSGCGKTTLMRLVAGFEDPDAGRISIGGRDMAGAAPYERPVNMMFQSYALFPHMSVEKNVAFGLVQARLPKPDIATRVAEMLRLVQLESLGSRKPDQLSGGQRQRVALARALARRPRLLLLDEPLAALDRKLREETQFELRRVQRELGTSFLLVTHDQDEAMAMAQRIAVMRAGGIEQMGAPRDIYERPANRFVASFLGDANLFDATVLGIEGGVVRIGAESAEVTAPLPDAPLSVGDKPTLAVRLECVRLSRDFGAPHALTGEVSDIGYRGEASVVRVRLASGALLRATLPHADVARLSLSIGDRVSASFEPDDARILTQ